MRTGWKWEFPHSSRKCLLFGEMVRCENRIKRFAVFCLVAVTTSASPHVLSKQGRILSVSSPWCIVSACPLHMHSLYERKRRERLAWHAALVRFDGWDSSNHWLFHLCIYFLSRAIIGCVLPPASVAMLMSLVELYVASQLCLLHWGSFVCSARSNIDLRWPASWASPNPGCFRTPTTNSQPNSPTRSKRAWIPGWEGVLSRFFYLYRNNWHAFANIWERHCRVTECDIRILLAIIRLGARIDLQVYRCTSTKDVDPSFGTIGGGGRSRKELGLPRQAWDL